MFGLLTDNINHLMSERCPVVTTSEESIRVGRTGLRRLATHLAAEESERKYFLTKAASRLLEFVAAAVNNSEPVLLVGETGVGKTSAIQASATLSHVPHVLSYY